MECHSEEEKIFVYFLLQSASAKSSDDSQLDSKRMSSSSCKLDEEGDGNLRKDGKRDRKNEADDANAANDHQDQDEEWQPTAKDRSIAYDDADVRQANRYLP